MQAAISFELTYTYEGETDLHGPVTINIPKEAIATGTCNDTFETDNTIKIQILRLSFWNTWWAEFRFTQDKNSLGAPSLQQYFNLYQVVVYADYHANYTLFPHATTYNKTYFTEVDPKTGDGALLDMIFAAPYHTFVCPSKQRYMVVTNPDGTAILVLSNLKVHAFATSADWMESEICPEDQNPNDIIPVVVGGVLALMVVVTLIGYLVYRSRLPPETLHMTNPNSHFEDVAFENKGHVIEDEDTSDADSHLHQRGHANNKH